MSKVKLLMLSDSPTTTTGFGNITKNILNKIDHKKFECHCVGHNYFGQTLKPAEFVNGQKMNFYLHGTGKAKYAMDMISPIIRNNKIDIFGILLDTFMCYESGFLNVDTSPAKTFFYYPTDGGNGLPLNCHSILQKVDLPVGMSKFAQLQIKKAHGINSVYIPHAYDHKVFRPLSAKKKKKIRQKWKLDNKFIIGTVARNQGRKMLDRMVKAFAIFCKDKPDAILLMHTDPNDMASSFQIFELINRLKINNRVIFTGATFHNPFSEKQLNEVYNMMDVFFLSTSGEGFGVPTIEAMGCGVPQVLTDYTTTRELIYDDIQTGLMVNLAGETEQTPHPHTSEILDGTITGSWNVERGVMSIPDSVAKLNILYNDRNFLKKLSKNSLIKAKEYYTWDVVIPEWEKALLGLMK